MEYSGIGISSNAMDKAIIYSDVQASDWYYEDLSFIDLQENTIITGYTEGTFRPNATLNLDQFIAMAVRYFGITEAGYAALGEVDSSADVALLEALAYDTLDTEAFPLMEEQAEIANRLGVSMAFYEGGQLLLSFYQ